jgi:hypothetical protein
MLRALLTGMEGMETSAAAGAAAAAAAAGDDDDDDAGAMLADVPTPVSASELPNPMPFGPKFLAWQALQ